jgi:two-component system phosphate regulon sensor histidine kinase PhoR
MQMKYNFEPDGHYFGVIFPSKSAIILKQLDFWIYSSIIILFIAIFFSYTVFVLLQQKRLSEVKNDFINNMTHEFKTPISTINLSADVLSDPQIATQPDRMKQYVEIIRNENDRLRSQVEKVLQIATLNPKKVKIKHEDVDVHKIIMTAAKSLELRVHDEEGELTVNLTAGQHHISGDHVHLSNIIYNLMDNAIKYTERAPQITIFTRNHGDDFVLSISDNGVGISSQHQKMIFDKFYRVPTGDRHNVKGFGLGLFYVKTMVHALKGKIEVRSVLGVGSTFTLKFKTIPTE